MSSSPGFFGPSQRALDFGVQYAEVLARWARLFEAASALVEANVTLGQQATDAGKEFEDLLQASANAPWNMFSPEMVQRFMRVASGGAPAASEPRTGRS